MFYYKLNDKYLQSMRSNINVSQEIEIRLRVIVKRILCKLFYFLNTSGNCRVRLNFFMEGINIDPTNKKFYSYSHSHYHYYSIHPVEILIHGLPIDPFEWNSLAALIYITKLSSNEIIYFCNGLSGHTINKYLYDDDQTNILCNMVGYALRCKFMKLIDFKISNTELNEFLKQEWGIFQQKINKPIMLVY